MTVPINIRDYADSVGTDDLYIALEHAVDSGKRIYVYANPIDETGIDDASEAQAKAALREDPSLVAVEQSSWPWSGVSEATIEREVSEDLARKLGF